MSLRNSLMRGSCAPNGFAVRVIFALAVLLAIPAGPARTQDSPLPPPPPASAPQDSPQNPQGRPAPPVVPAITTTTGLVHLVVTVTDHHHHFITDLDKSDFKVIENGMPQDIKFFGRETDLPLRIAFAARHFQQHPPPSGI